MSSASSSLQPLLARVSSRMSSASSASRESRSVVPSRRSRSSEARESRRRLSRRSRSAIASSSAAACASSSRPRAARSLLELVCGRRAAAAPQDPAHRVAAYRGPWRRSRCRRADPKPSISERPAGSCEFARLAMSPATNEVKRCEVRADNGYMDPLGARLLAARIRAGVAVGTRIELLGDVDGSRGSAGRSRRRRRYRRPRPRPRRLGPWLRRPDRPRADPLPAPRRLERGGKRCFPREPPFLSLGLRARAVTPPGRLSRPPAWSLAPVSEASPELAGPSQAGGRFTRPEAGTN